jgi:hypothetical protein
MTKVVQKVMEKVSVLVSGKLGDLIHSLYVCQVLFNHFNKKSVVYITDTIEPFENGLQGTYGELRDSIIMQPWCEDFRMWNNEPIEVNTTLFRRSPKLYRNCWKEIFNETFSTPILTGAWLEYHSPKKRENTLVISRRYKTPMLQKAKGTYELFIEQYEDVIFLGSEHDYNMFDLKEKCRLVIPNTISDWLFNIKTCGLFMGNQSSPLAMASALDVSRVAELFGKHIIDYIHYIGEEKYSENMSWFINE